MTNRATRCYLIDRHILQSQYDLPLAGRYRPTTAGNEANSGMSFLGSRRISGSVVFQLLCTLISWILVPIRYTPQLSIPFHDERLLSELVPIYSQMLSGLT